MGVLSKACRKAGLAGLAARGTAVLALLWLGHSAASLAWLLFPGPGLPQVDMPLVVNRAVLGVDGVERRKVVDMDRLLSLPFSPGGRAAGQSSDRQQVAVTTGLALVLKGTVPSSDPRTSRAIIAEGERQSIVQAGAPLPISTAGVSLAEVLVDRVVLDNNGRAEVLWMDARAAGAERSGKAGSEPGSVVPGGTLEQYATLPAALQSVLSATPQLAANGKFGLRLESTGNGRLFRRLGFRNDDVIIGIDGQEFHAGMEPAVLASALQGKRSARLRILRNEQMLELDTDLSLLD